jgi:hypothetical protein
MTQHRSRSRFETDDVGSIEKLYPRVRAGIDATPASAVAMRTRIALTFVFVPCATALVVSIASSLVYDRQVVGLDVAGESVAHLLFVLSVLTGVTLVATSMSLSQGPRGFGSGVSMLALTALLVAPIYAAAVVVQPVHAGSSAALTVALSPWGARCLGVASTIAALVLAIFTVALRHLVPVASRLRGAALGAAAGAWAGLGVFVFCPGSEIPHLLIGHVLPIVVFTVLGLTAIPRLLRT